MTRLDFEPILPDFAKFLDPDTVERELIGALDHTANIVRDDFGKTVRTWRNKPSFDKKGPRRAGGGIVIDVYTGNEIYFYVTKGTRRHVIRPKSAGGRLGFQAGYTAKTRARVIGSRAGGPRGPFVTAKSVVHPGTEARDFDKEIARRRQKNLVNLSRLAILRSFRFGGIR